MLSNCDNSIAYEPIEEEDEPIEEEEKCDSEDSYASTEETNVARTNLK